MYHKTTIGISIKMAEPRNGNFMKKNHKTTIMVNQSFNEKETANKVLDWIVGALCPIQQIISVRKKIGHI